MVGWSSRNVWVLPDVAHDDARRKPQLAGASRACFWFARFAALVWQATHCHLVRSHSAFAVVTDGFDRTSFHGFLAQRLLLRRGRLLKHIGVAAVVAAPEISGCGLPAQVAVNTLRFEDLKTLMAAMGETTTRKKAGVLDYWSAIKYD